MNPKILAARKAAELVEDGAIIGLGSGTTAAFAIDILGQRVREGLSIKAVASSRQSEMLATKAGIQLIPFSEVLTINQYIDGADEIDEQMNLIKGGGGALLREKILAFHAEKFIVIADSSKLVKRLGKFPLAVEVIPFAYELTAATIGKLPCAISQRMVDAKPFVSDNGNYILDCRFEVIEDVVALDRELKSIPGVVETGLFENGLVDLVIIGDENDDVKIHFER